MSGWIKLHRKITEHWIWDDPEKLKWWLDLIMMANHKPRDILINSEIVTIDVGERHTSEKKLADRWNCSRKRVSNFLELLEKEEMIVFSKSRQRGTSYKIVNYADYQANKETKEHRGNIDIRGTLGEQGSYVENGVSNTFQNEFKNTQKGTSNKLHNSNDNSHKTKQGEHQKNIESTSEEHRGNIAGTSKEHREHINKNDKELKELEELQETTTGNIKKMNSGDNPLHFYENNFGMASPYIREDIIKWHEEEGMEPQAIIYALELANEREKTYNYAKGILNNWWKKDIRTRKDAEAESMGHQRKNNFSYGKKSIQKESMPDWDDDPSDNELVDEEESESLQERLDRLKKLREGVEND